MPSTRRERLERITAYPLLWAALYVLWLGFAAGLLFWFVAVRPPSLAAALLVAAAIVPPALLWVSNWMQRVYDPDRPR